MRKSTMIALAGTVLAAMAPATATMAGNWVEVGVLKCEVGSGVGMIVTSKRSMDCQFRSNDASASEGYNGSLNRVGLDLGRTEHGRMVWAVFATNLVEAEGQLAGSYGGISAQASLGYGVGANALIGGFSKSVMLQPLSVSTQKGIDIALGVASLNLELQ
jgi:Protein of unknown function (DUF992)